MSPTVITFVLLALLTTHTSYAKPVETSGEITKNSTTQNYYPAEMLNLVTLGMFGNAKQYLFAEQQATWMEASYFCNAHGMDLVTIETKEENDLIMEHIASLGEQVALSSWGRVNNKNSSDGSGGVWGLGPTLPIPAAEPGASSE